ncbi:MAG: hypothetical protein WCG73_02265, partial [Candidatus Moraniibacteriota bacterium]
SSRPQTIADLQLKSFEGDIMTIKETALTVVGILGTIFLVIAVYMGVPLLNENWLQGKLDPAFEEFKGVTRQKYPDKAEREAAFTKVLAEKARVVESNSLPLITCGARFIAQSPGKVYRKNVREVFCTWKSLW